MAALVLNPKAEIRNRSLVVEDESMGDHGVETGTSMKLPVTPSGFGLLSTFGLRISDFYLAVGASPTWKRTKRRMVIWSPNCLATEPTCSLTEISEFFLTNPWSTRQ